MTRTRVIPVLLIKDGGLVKTVKFKDEKYIGDPINAVKIFNEKEVDEIMILDITATVENRKPDIKRIAGIASECFMPVCYGGGITKLDEIKELFFTGIEKISLNASAIENPKLITEAATLFGNQSIVVSIDVKQNLFAKNTVFTHRGKTNTNFDPVQFAKQMENMGAGEIFLNSMDRDGTYSGYDFELIQKVSSAVNIPLIACGGAKDIDDFIMAVRNGASAVAAGSMFVYHGKIKGVLINFPSQEILRKKLYAVS